MSSVTSIAAAETRLAILETGELAARRVADLFAESFAADEVAVSLVDNGEGPNTGQRIWRVTIHFAAPPDEAAMRELAAAAGGDNAGQALRFETIAAKDWVGESLAGLKPVTAGRFVIHGAHDRDSVPSNHIGIEIEAALAFGTGHHGTTRGCLLALDHIGKGAHTPRRILDVGTGTGILAIAGARALRAKTRGSIAPAIGSSSSTPTASRRPKFAPVRRSIWSSLIFCSGRSSVSPRRSEAFSHLAAVSCCPAFYTRRPMQYSPLIAP